MHRVLLERLGLLRGEGVDRLVGDHFVGVARERYGEQTHVDALRALFRVGCGQRIGGAQRHADFGRTVGGGLAAQGVVGEYADAEAVAVDLFRGLERDRTHALAAECLVGGVDDEAGQRCHRLHLGDDRTVRHFLRGFAHEGYLVEARLHPAGCGLRLCGRDVEVGRAVAAGRHVVERTVGVVDPDFGGLLLDGRLDGGGSGFGIDLQVGRLHVLGGVGEDAERIGFVPMEALSVRPAGPDVVRGQGGDLYRTGISVYGCRLLGGVVRAARCGRCECGQV